MWPFILCLIENFPKWPKSWDWRHTCAGCHLQKYDDFFGKMLIVMIIIIIYLCISSREHAVLLPFFPFLCCERERERENKSQCNSIVCDLSFCVWLRTFPNGRSRGIGDTRAPDAIYKNMTSLERSWLWWLLFTYAFLLDNMLSCYLFFFSLLRERERETVLLLLNLKLRFLLIILYWKWANVYLSLKKKKKSKKEKHYIKKIK